MDMSRTDLMLIADTQSLLTLILQLLALLLSVLTLDGSPWSHLDSIILLFVFFRTLRISTVYLRLTLFGTHNMLRPTGSAKSFNNRPKLPCLETTGLHSIEVC